MASFENKQGITLIKMHKKTRHFCPLGNDWYTARIEVELVPGETIMDYCDVDRFFKAINKGEQIIEDVVAQVFGHFEVYGPKALKVTASVMNAAHLPVEVTKERGCAR